MYINSFSWFFFLVIALVMIQDIACKKPNALKANNGVSKQTVARLNRRKVVVSKRQTNPYYTQGYQTYPTNPSAAAAAYYPSQANTASVQPITTNGYTYPQQYAAPATSLTTVPAAAPAAAPAANPLELGGLLSNLKLPALPSLAPAAPAGGSQYSGYPYYYGAPAAKPKDEDDDDDEDDEEGDDEKDDDKNNEDDDEEE